MVSVLTTEMVKAVTASGSLAFPELVVTVMVQLLWVPAAKVLKKMVLFPEVALSVSLEQSPE